MATHSSVLAWRIPGTGEPGGLSSMGSHRVGHDSSDLAAAAVVPANVVIPGSQLWGFFCFFFKYQGSWARLWIYRLVFFYLCFELRVPNLHYVCMCAQSCLTLWESCSPPGSSVHGIFRQEHWCGLPFPSPGDLPSPRARTRISCVSCITGEFFTTEPSGKPQSSLYVFPLSWAV